MNLKNKIIKSFYELGLKEKEEDLKLYYLWNSFLEISQLNKEESDGLRASIRRFIETNIDDIDADLDYEDFKLDVFYERPVFEDLRVEEDRDLYYYQDFNTNRNIRANDDYLLSIRTFQRILEDSDLISIYMSIFKIYNFIVESTNDKYDERVKRLITGSNYILETALKNIVEEEGIKK